MFQEEHLDKYLEEVWQNVKFKRGWRKGIRMREGKHRFAGEGLWMGVFCYGVKTISLQA